MISYSNYYKTHSNYLQDDDDTNFKMSFKYYFNNIKRHLPLDCSKLKVIEIWCWKWKFANFCKKSGVREYIWFDLDKEIILKNKKLFPKYEFSYSDIFEYLKDKNRSFDIVFMSHVFEHFEREGAQEIIKLIRNCLTERWTFINIMPNWWSLLYANWWRYNDITHTTLYTENSFTQVLMLNGFSIENIQHYNTVCPNVWIEVIRKSLKQLIKFFVLLLGYPFQRIHTFEIITTVKK